MSDGSEGPEAGLARAVALALRAELPEREATALHLAELLLDATEAALPLVRGGDADAALAQAELLAERADVYAWDGPPGWDEVLARGLVAQPAPLSPGPSVLDGLGTAPARADQRAAAVAAARSEAARLVELGRAVAALRGSAASGAAAAGAVVAAHASVLRLVGHAAIATALSLPEEAHAGDLGAPGTAPLVAEMDARAAAGSEFASAQEEWLARLAATNEPAALPAFRTFFAGLSQVPRVAIALRGLGDEARAGRLAGDREALLGAIGGWQPVRWSALRRGAPAAFFTLLCPAAPPVERPLDRLARECDCALDAAGRLFFARNFSRAAFTTLAAIFTARCAAALALWQELDGGG